MLDRTLFPVPTYTVPGALLVQGDCRDLLGCIPAGSVQCVVTSPPYWGGLRDYGIPATIWEGEPACSHAWGARERGRRSDLRPLDQTRSRGRLGTAARQGMTGLDGGQFCLRCGAWRGSLGLEPTVDLYVEHLVAILRKLRRVLRADGTLWLNLGDCYASPCPRFRRNGVGPGSLPNSTRAVRPPRLASALKEKDLVGVPWRVALALQTDGWYLRSDIVWAKPNNIPESVRDRPTRAHEYLFLLTKSPHYFYDADAVREQSVSTHGSGNGFQRAARLRYRDANGGRGSDQPWEVTGWRNRRTIWPIPTRGYGGAHPATFPPALVEPCILAGTSAKGCCSRCGAPWERIVERGDPLRAWQQACGGDATGQYRGRARKAYTAAGAQDASAVKARILTGMRERKMVGWRPTCACAAGAPIPCVVLDPFAGVATTGLVARQWGRAFVGIELSRAYIELARKRLSMTPWHPLDQEDTRRGMHPER
jgi:DNA modification methylase